MTGDLLIKNGRLWAAADRPVVAGGAVLVGGGRILRTGRFTARAKTVVDARGGLIMPGFVQGHVHFAQTLFRGRAEDRPLLPWLRERIWPMEAAHTAASLRASADLTCAELIRGGTTAFLSMETVRHTGVVLEAAAAAGLAGAVGFCLMDESGGCPELAVPLERALTECDGLARAWSGHARLRLAVAPRFALSCTPDNLRRAAAFARGRGLRLHTHASEQEAEIAEVAARTGRANLEFLHDMGLTGPDVGLAHCVHVTAAELQILRRTRTCVLHCPSANMKLGSGIAPVPEFLEAGIPVALGADGAPCNNRLDMFLEMRTAALLQKIRLGPTALPAWAVVRMATEGGAAALGWSDEVGTLDPGKRANLIVVDDAGPHAVPSPDPATTLVYSGSAADVRLTVVDGRILYDGVRVRTLDEPAVRRRAVKEARALARRAGLGP